ncbi:MAG: MBL fold metallo-hydrolase [Thermomicrobiales bacterium]
MRVVSLGSGSSGNGFLLDTGTIALLIDCGVAVRACQSAIRDYGVAGRLAGIVVSHEHGDHVRGIPSITRRLDIPLITTHGTHGALRTTLRLDRHASGQRYADSTLEVTFIGVSHDAAEPCGFVVEHDGMRVAIFTDLGYVSCEVLDALDGADIIVLEANYDVRMLMNSHYPPHLKRRIQGPAGHLSNDDCATALAATASSRTQAIWLAHLSDKNNTPNAAVGAVSEALALAGLDIPIAPLPRFERAEITNVPSRQLQLGW